MGPYLKGILTIVPQVNIFEMGVNFADYETSTQGINRVTAKQFDYKFSFQEGLWLFVVGFFVFLALGLYLEAVLPRQYGTRKHPCFMFKPSTYSCRCCKRKDASVDDEELSERCNSYLLKNEDEGGMEVRNLKPENYEPVAPEFRR